ncbi:class I SAM-dependent methyltransferase [Geodermatophilus sp. SYSU D01105]
MIRGLWPSADGLALELSGTVADVVVDVEIDGRRVWSFRTVEAPVPPSLLPPGVPAEKLTYQPWPVSLRARLAGRFRVRVRASGEDDGPEVQVSLDGGFASPRLVDRYGAPLVVNKWGRLGHALGDAPPGMVDRMLDTMDGVRAVLERHLGPTVYVTGGTLLGPVREAGRLLPHDDDADLGYLSRHTAPVDVDLEGFEVGRLLTEAGYEVVRLSGGHLQIHVRHAGAPDHYVDVFPGFLLDGYWHQPFALRVPARYEELLPTTDLEVAGRVEPAPAQPELALERLYGSGWRVPDPAYTFVVPLEIGDRFWGWFADFNVDREPWEDEVLLRPEELDPPARMSATARWVHREAPVGSAVLELGCGLGADAVGLAALGRTVHAVDYSREAVRVARARAEQGTPVTFEVLNLYDLRAVLRLGVRLAARPEPWTVFGRHLLNALEPLARDNLFRLCGMLVRRGTAAHLDLLLDPDEHLPLVPHRRLTPDQVADEAARHGLVLDEAVPALEPATWLGAPEERLVETSRLTLRRRTP